MFQPRSIQSSLSFRDKLYSIDYVLVISILVLGITSMFAMYSTDGGEFKYHTESHILRFFVFFLMFLVLSFVQIRFWHSTSYLIYFIFLILLLGVKYFGLTSSGSQRWLNFYFMNLQPSELMKIGLILFLAKYYHRIPIESVNKLKFLFLPIFVLISPVLLVVMQPDLGTALIIACSGLFVLFLSGLSWTFMGGSFVLLIISSPFIWNILLQPFQRQRIATYFNPESDPFGASWNIIQSKVAIGSGGLLGKGFGEGSQTQLNFLPETETDFIFSVIGEEFGFIGVLLLLSIYLFILLRCFYLALSARDRFCRLVIGGLSLTFAANLIINLCMVVGLLPVVGMPLPFISKGGSSLMSLFLAFGIIVSMGTHKKFLPQ